MIKFLRTFNVRHMTAAVYDAQLGSVDLLIESCSEADRNQFVITTPKNECRLLNRAKLPVEDILAADHGVQELANRVAVAGSHSLLKRKIGIFIEALVMKC